MGRRRHDLYTLTEDFVFEIGMSIWTGEPAGTGTGTGIGTGTGTQWNRSGRDRDVIFVDFWNREPVGTGTGRTGKNW